MPGHWREVGDVDGGTGEEWGKTGQHGEGRRRTEEAKNMGKAKRKVGKGGEAQKQAEILGKQEGEEKRGKKGEE